MVRLFFALLAAASFAGAAGAGGYDDPEGRFSVTVPQGWEAAKPDVPQIALVIMGMRENKLLGLCAVVVTPTPDTKSMSQSEIDDTLTQQLTEEEWRRSLKAAAGNDAKIEATGSRDANGRKAHFAVATFSVKKADGTAAALKTKTEIHAIPGTFHEVGCLAEDYEAASPDFETIFLSYVPKRELIVRGPDRAAPALLTFFEGAAFTGAARVVGQDVADFAALGWGGAVGSVSVAGFGQWEVCEGANFAGTCRVLGTSETAAPGHMLRIGSARRIEAAGAGGLAGVFNAATNVWMRTAIDRFRAR